ncbi:MAG: hypothetical protein EBS49_07660, partial [Verrucomicrobia bacterium]|nr:hypothetical protein [Verrucomicrobiota bacterium]
MGPIQNQPRFFSQLHETGRPAGLCQASADEGFGKRQVTGGGHGQGGILSLMLPFQRKSPRGQGPDNFPGATQGFCPPVQHPVCRRRPGRGKNRNPTFQDPRLLPADPSKSGTEDL